jgi:carbon-monoxide dehydrogenase medium subunit
MIPPAFEYLRPKTIPEAIAFLQQFGEDAKILSGGQSLIPMMKFRLARPGYLIDINRISGLSYIKEEGGYLKIGGLTREAELESSPLIHSRYPIILDTARVIADPQVRNMATWRMAIRRTIIRQRCSRWGHRLWPSGRRARECFLSRASL